MIDLLELRKQLDGIDSQIVKLYGCVQAGCGI